MASEDDDEDVARAIALSLQESPAGTVDREVIVIDDDDASDQKHREVITIDDSDEDDELKRAIELSIRDTSANPQAEKEASPEYEQDESLYESPKPKRKSSIAEAQTRIDAVSAPPVSSAQSTSSATGILGLDRAAMERERLARQMKRKRSMSPDMPLKNKERKEGTLASLTPSHLSSRQQIKPESGVGDREGGKEPVTSTSPIQYPRGTIKRTWAFKHPRTNDIKIEEVVQAKTCTTAILSAFDWDDRWLYSKLDPHKIKQVWVMNAKGEELQHKLRQEAKEAKTPVSIHFPNMSGVIAIMHCKFMLLFHPTHLRVAIPTANFLPVDWGETPPNRRTGQMWQPACMENSVFIVDLPRRAADDVGPREELTQFGKGLLGMIEAMDLHARVCEGVLKFDFSDTKHLGFVHSMGGSYLQRDDKPTGLLGLSDAVRGQGLGDVKLMELDYAASSIGALSDDFLQALYFAASGNTPAMRHTSDIRQRVRIYFPLDETVVKSTGGTDCGGTNTLRRAHFLNPRYPRECMRDYKSTRPGVLSHNKLLLARGRRGADLKPFAWAYIGSANVTESAWGKVSELRGQGPKITCRNWECGVVVPVLEGLEDVDSPCKERAPGMDVFKNTLEIPFEYPGEHYGDKKPWFFMEKMR